MENNKGILQQIKEGKTEPSEDKRKFKQAIYDLFEAQHKNSYQPRELWLFDDALKQFHKEMGDKQFYKMVTTYPITTNVKGEEYIQNFIDEYEK